MANITDCTIQNLNKLLKYLYGDKGAPFVADGLDMSMRYVFPFYLQESDIALLTKSGVIPRPSGVKVSAIIIEPSSTFGFNEAGGQPFGQGAFFTEKGVINVA
jgi:hypothetical protein